MSQYDYSQTASSNSSIGGINVAENCAPGNIDNAIREGMADAAKQLSDTGGALDTGGSSNAYTVTTATTHSAYADGLHLMVRANHTNTGAATLNVDTLGAKAIKKFTKDGVADVEANDIQAGALLFVSYDSANGYFLALQVGALGTMARQDADAVAITGGTVSGVSGLGVITVQTFTSGGTYTPTSGAKYAIVELVGGGGAGGGAAAGTSTGDGSAGAGGGAGAYIRSDRIDVSGGGYTATITVGAAGAGSAGATGGSGTASSYADGTITLSAGAGGGGKSTGSVTNPTGTTGGSGGSPSATAHTPTIQVSGGRGAIGLAHTSDSTGDSFGGNGGTAPFGGGGGGSVANAGTQSNAGVAAEGYGAGGGGAANINAAAAAAGGNGSAGIVIITEYL